MDLLTTVVGLLLLIGGIFLALHIAKKNIEVWIPLLFLYIIELLRVLPLGA